MTRGIVNDPTYQNSDLWVKELTAAGWEKWRGSMTVWRSPDGALFRGPFGAWKAMKSMEQWPQVLGGALK